jgi:hypothetical protein
VAIEAWVLNEKHWKENNLEATASARINPQHVVADELVKLRRLKEKGVLTEEEFEKQKQKALS